MAVTASEAGRPATGISRGTGQAEPIKAGARLNAFKFAQAEGATSSSCCRMLTAAVSSSPKASGSGARRHWQASPRPGPRARAASWARRLPRPAPGTGPAGLRLRKELKPGWARGSPTGGAPQMVELAGQTRSACSTVLRFEQGQRIRQRICGPAGFRACDRGTQRLAP